MPEPLEHTSTVTVAGCPLHFTVQGQGPLVLMIQGVGVHGRGWSPQVGTRRMRRRGFLGLVMPPGRVSDTEHEAARLADLFGHDLADTPPAAREQLRAMRRADATPRLTELAGVPTSIVSARHDPIAPRAIGRALLGIPGARFVEIDDASHGLPITHAAVVNALVCEHLSEAERRLDVTRS